MSSAPYPRSPADRPQDDLAYIRGAMDAARTFTAVPGFGLMGMGAVALGAVVVSHGWLETPWDGERNLTSLLFWLIALTLAMAIGSHALLNKTQRLGISLTSSLFRKVVLGMVPSLAVGGVLTLGLYLRADDWSMLPALWLGCYGLGVLAAGQYSILPVVLMGLAFVVLAAVSILAPPALGLLWLAAGFGALHLCFGAWIAWRHDG